MIVRLSLEDDDLSLLSNDSLLSLDNDYLIYI